MTLDNLLQDLKYAVRGLRTKPGFAIAVVSTLALGIGANTAMFGIVDRLLFRPPPLLRDPALTHRVYVAQTNRGERRTHEVSRYVRYVDLAKWTRSFSRTAGHARRDLAVGVGDAAREMSIAAVSASFFGFFDAPPALGRYFTAAEDTPPDGAAVAVLSHAMWQTAYGGRRDVLGSKLKIGPSPTRSLASPPRASSASGRTSHRPRSSPSSPMPQEPGSARRASRGGRRTAGGGCR